MKIIEYTQLGSIYANSLIEEVNEKISEGWQPFQNSFVRDEYIYQAMVKYEPPVISVQNITNERCHPILSGIAYQTLPYKKDSSTFLDEVIRANEVMKSREKTREDTILSQVEKIKQLEDYIDSMQSEPTYRQKLESHCDALVSVIEDKEKENKRLERLLRRCIESHCEYGDGIRAPEGYHFHLDKKYFSHLTVDGLYEEVINSKD